MGSSNDTDQIPIFPLANLVLFPDAKQRLHVFEPRYRQMAEDALDGEKKIGIVLLRDPDGVDGPDEVYSIGCVGDITESRRLPDGRFVLLLEGRSPFRIIREEATGKLYRSVTAELIRELGWDEMDPLDREALEATRDELQARLLEIVRATAPATELVLRERMQMLDPVQLGHALAFGLDCDPVEKQSLLEANGPVERCRRLSSLLEFRRIEASLPDGPRTLN